MNTKYIQIKYTKGNQLSYHFVKTEDEYKRFKKKMEADGWKVEKLN